MGGLQTALTKTNRLLEIGLSAVSISRACLTSPEGPSIHFEAMKNCRKKGERAARYALIGNRVKILRAAGNSVYPYIQGGPTSFYTGN